MPEYLPQGTIKTISGTMQSNFMIHPTHLLSQATALGGKVRRLFLLRGFEMGCSSCSSLTGSKLAR
jgi:hypothetical protein